MSWDDISTAPKDGRDFLAYWPDIWSNNGWNVERTWFHDGQFCTPNTSQKTHSGPTLWWSLMDEGIFRIPPVRGQF